MQTYEMVCIKHHLIFYMKYVQQSVGWSVFYLQVDKHIRRLDTDLARFEADLKEKQIESTDYDSTSSKGKKGACQLDYLATFIFLFCLFISFAKLKPVIQTLWSTKVFVISGDSRQKEKKMAKTRSKVKSSDEDGSPKSAQKKVKLLQAYVAFLPYLCGQVIPFIFLHYPFYLVCFRIFPPSSFSLPIFPFIRGEFNSPSSNFGNVHPSDVLDMPVDPNEPTYCLCHQVSYGEMIGCDNTDVSFKVLTLTQKNVLMSLLSVDLHHLIEALAWISGRNIAVPISESLRLYFSLMSSLRCYSRSQKILCAGGITVRWEQTGPH